MDIQIDSEKLKSLRKAKAWSQQHLAEVSGLSVKTIQRFERKSSGSYESIKAIASVFEISASDLQKISNGDTKDLEEVTLRSVKNVKQIKKRIIQLPEVLRFRKPLLLGVCFGVVLTLSFQQITRTLFPLIASLNEEHPTEATPMIINSDRVDMLDDGSVQYTGNVSIKLLDIKQLIALSKQELVTTSGRVLLGDVSLESEDFLITTDEITLNQHNDFISLYSDSIVAIKKATEIDNSENGNIPKS